LGSVRLFFLSPAFSPRLFASAEPGCYALGHGRLCPRYEHHDFLNASDVALANAPLQVALGRLADTLIAGNRRAFASFGDKKRDS
jgi:hypothetical protein